MSPRWISKDGEWHPAKEHVVLPHLSGTDKEVYDGPDRAALLVLFQEKVDHLGSNFKHDPDLLMRVKSLGYENIEQYCKEVGYDEKKAEEDFKEKAVKVESHEIEKRVKMVETLGGGIDSTGQGQDTIGGFGEEKLNPLNKK